ncbi:MAG: GNAT family N-acetyltransferase [Pseudomonadota bacterium]
MKIAQRAFDFDKDLAAIKRIWREIGWTDEDSEKQLDLFFSCGRTVVGTLDDVAECSVHTVPGSIRLASTDLSLCAVTAVTTSRVARGQSFARKLTAEQLQHARAQGVAVAALGMFDQGFYDQLGFGTGAYDHQLTFDPASLTVPILTRNPVRLTPEESGECHAALLKRKREHGAVCLDPPEMFKAELGFSKDSFGLGFRDADGELTHFIWLETEDEVLRGPYSLRAWAYRSAEQLLELLSLLRSLSDQVYSVTLMEPPELQLQALLRRPMRHMVLTRGSKHASTFNTMAWYQLRVLDVAQVVKALPPIRTPLRFALQITDPLSEHGEQHCAGDYVVSLDKTSTAIREADTDLPELSCSINAFTRWVFGVAPATSLALTDSFAAEPELLQALDAALQLPRPILGWDF